MKTEKEKMLAGEVYDCADNELLTRWHKAKQLQQEYNNTLTTDAGKISDLLDELIGSRGDYIGKNVEINMNCVFLDCNKIVIGDNSGIGPGVHIYTVFHSTKASERTSENSTFWKSQTAPVIIGNNVWIGGGCIILPGVTIGDNTTIGAGSVVTKSIPANVLAVGNPCRILKQIEY